MTVADNNDDLLHAVEAAKTVVRLLVAQIDAYQRECPHPESARRPAWHGKSAWCRRCHKTLPEAPE